MNNVTLTIENELISLAGSLYSLNQEVNDLYQYYWGTTANTLIDELATGTTPATTASAGSLSKTGFLNGVTVITALKNFLGNAAVSTSDYMSLADTVRNGSTPITGSALSGDVEDIGKRIKAAILDMIQINKNASNIEKIYNVSSLSAVIGSIPTTTEVFGCNLTQARLVSGIVLVQQFQKMMGNQAVTQGDYLSTVQNLVRGS